MYRLTILIFLIPLMAIGQIEHDTLKIKILKNAISKGRSNLKINDSAQILNDFIWFTRSVHQESILKNKEYSYVQSESLMFYKNNIYTKSQRALNLFDTLVNDFTNKYVLKYKWVSNRKSKLIDVLFTIIYNSEEDTLTLEIKDCSSFPYLLIYKENKELDKL